MVRSGGRGGGEDSGWLVVVDVEEVKAGGG